MSTQVSTVAFGFPRLGPNREYKKALESYWSGEDKSDDSGSAAVALQAALTALQTDMDASYAEAGVEHFATGEVTKYDWVIDAAISVGLYGDRVRLSEYYERCRGESALELTKWFNTNYHYLVPRFDNVEPGQLRAHCPSWLPTESDAQRRPAAAASAPRFMLGPFTLLKLSRGVGAGARFAEFARAVGRVYGELVARQAAVHMHEPAFALDLDDDDVAAAEAAYQRMREVAGGRCHITLFSYYGRVDFLPRLFKLPVNAIGLDFVSDARALDHTLQVLKSGGGGGAFPHDKRLVAGVVDGRSVWRTDVADAVAKLRRLQEEGGVRELAVSNSAPLFHLPHTIEGERDHLDSALLERLAFAKEKLEDIRRVADAFNGKTGGAQEGGAAGSAYGANVEVQRRVAALRADDFTRPVPYAERVKAQRNSMRGVVPELLPATTIGSFPQTPEIRKKRAAHRRGDLSTEAYEKFIDETIADNIRRQEELGLDVLVHGEPERSDMVEFFAEKLDGIATTKNGWVLAYGSRSYRPPIIYGDVSRPAPMTLKEIKYAQSLTSKPVKGMLTGPVTIIAWSFVRKDVAVDTVAYQLALALQDEVRDYEQGGVRIAQIDEAAFREAAPVKRDQWPEHFAWATRAFCLCGAKAAPTTQIHTHMCYSSFAEIMRHIVAMDFDVILIEATRSECAVLSAFESSGSFDRQIGLGVYDIHSVSVPTADSCAALIAKAVEKIPARDFWVNPDCGLKTRTWEQVTPALRNMVAAAQRMRGELARKA